MNTSSSSVAKPAQWTLMIYMAGDNSLSIAGEADLDEMRRVGSSDDVNVLVLYDSFGPQGAERGRIEKDARNEHIQTLKELDSGDPKNLVAFAEWAVKHYPAERYGLILWSHGSGWRPEEVKQVAAKVGTQHLSANERSVTAVSRVLFRPTLETILALPTPAERAICIDDATGHSLDTIELGLALQQISAQLKRPLDLLGMDACLMSTLEVAYEVQPHAHYFVASEDLVPEGGWDYGLLLDALTAQPEMTGERLGRHVLDSYRRLRKGGSTRVNVAQTLAVFDLAHVNDLANAMDNFVCTLSPLLSQHSREVFDVLAGVKRFLDSTLWDVAGLCRLTADKFDSTELSQAAANVDEILAEGHGFVVRRKVLGGSEADYCGLAIYLPAMIDISTYYAKIAFAQQHQWLPFLNQLIPRFRRFR